jgi:integrase
MARQITPLGIQALKPRAKRYEKPIGNNLYVVVHPTGRKSFAVRYRYAGKQVKLTLPGGITLAAARSQAADALLEVTKGTNPVIAKRQQQQEARRVAEDTFEAITRNYFRREGGKLRSGRHQERILERLAFKTLGDAPIRTIRRSDIHRLLDRIEDHNGVAMAGRTLAIIGRVMNWHASRSDTFHSPIMRGMRPSKTTKRERILTDEELRAVWTTAEANPTDPFAALVLFLLLTACRRSEATDLVFGEVVGDLWMLPSARNKTNTELTRPLSKAALAILAERPRIMNCEFVFTADGRHGLGGVSRRKAHFDDQCGVRNWTLHDLRRSARSLMSRAGVPVDVSERALGHTIGGVRGVYDRHGYVAEMRIAFETLAQTVDLIVHPRGDNVTMLARG